MSDEEIQQMWCGFGDYKSDNVSYSKFDFESDSDLRV